MRYKEMEKVQVYCEPFCIEKGYLFEIHKVQYQEDDTYSCFLHFHEVHELIIFEQIDGSYYYNQGQSTLIDNDIVFTPGLETHDFELSERPKSWYIIQFLPELFNEADMHKASSVLQHGQHLRLQPKDIEIVQQMVKWLHQCYQANPLSGESLMLLRLVILWIAEHAQAVKSPNSVPISSSIGYAKLSPVIDLFRQQKAIDLTLTDAAKLCHISPSHFSRMFKSIFRCNFSEYSLQHKLYSAARLISQTDKSMTEISYELNFSSPSHFISQFKKQFSVTPKKYRGEIQHKG